LRPGHRGTSRFPIGFCIAALVRAACVGAGCVSAACAAPQPAAEPRPRAESEEILADEDQETTETSAPVSAVSAVSAAEGPTPAPAEPEEAVRARAALDRVSSPNNQLGLVLAVSEIASDLHWVLAVENRSAQEVSIAALPSLIQLEVTAPPTEVPAETAAPQAPILCATKLPATVDSSERLVIPAGGMLIHAINPNELCAEQPVLVQQASVKVIFGFPFTTKKLWKAGKLTEVDTEQKSPFFAESIPQGQEPKLTLKHITADPIVLGRTYPLAELTARAPSALDNNSVEQAETAELNKGPEEPFDVRIFPLGSAEKPETGLVRVEIKNISPKKVSVFVRREAFSYEVTGPLGSTSCKMLPRELAATTLSYSPMAPGASMQISTRLAEACPPGTWEEPGKYNVAVRFSPTSSGEEYDKDAYVGEIWGKNVAALTVPGASTLLGSPVRMQILPRR
jgi:hypothetical protein